MAFWDIFKRDNKDKKFRWVINTAGHWVYPSDNVNSYIGDGYKSLPNLYAIISRIVEKSSIVPFEIYKVRKGSESKYKKYKAVISQAKTGKDYARAIQLKNESLEKVEGSEVERLLYKPNSQQNIEQLNYELDGYKLLTGNSLLFMLSLIDGGKPKELFSIPSPFVSLIVDGNPFEPEIKFKVDFLQDTLSDDDVIHFKNWSPVLTGTTMADQYWGQSPLMSCRRLLGKYSDADETQGWMFKNQGPAGLLTGEGSDSGLQEEQAIAIKDKFRQQYQGSKNANDIIVTSAKLSWTSIGLSPVDLNIKEGKHEILSELCNVYHVPIGLFSDKNSTENNMIESRKALITDAVIPLVEARKQELQKELLPKFGDDLIIEYDYTIFHELQEDLEKLSNTAQKMYWITPNEKRAMTGYDKSDDPAMDKIYFPSNLIPIDDLSSDLGFVDEEMLNPET